MFARAVYIERQEHLCSVARHNMAALGITQAEIICGDSTQIIASTGHATMVFADPARRDAHGGRTFAISDCTPDVLAMKDMLLDKADFAMVKLSPMLDWHKAVADMGSCIGEVHIVSVGNECKELLLVMSRRYNGLERIFCVNDGQSFSFAPQPHNPTTVKPHNPTTAKPHNPTTANFLYEPNASIMKAGCFALLEQEYGASQLSRDSHLFISDEKITSFPGRGFAITAITTMNKKELKTALAGIDRANVSTRNFPLTADALRRKLRLKDGGNTYIFGTTAEDGKHILIIADKQTSRQADEQTSKRVDKQASKSNLLVYSSACLLVC